MNIKKYSKDNNNDNNRDKEKFFLENKTNNCYIDIFNQKKMQNNKCVTEIKINDNIKLDKEIKGNKINFGLGLDFKNNLNKKEREIEKEKGKGNYQHKKFDPSFKLKTLTGDDDDFLDY